MLAAAALAAPRADDAMASLVINRNCSKICIAGEGSRGEGSRGEASHGEGSRGGVTWAGVAWGRFT